MNIEQMAHEAGISILQRIVPLDTDQINTAAVLAWQYAEAMKAEQSKRKGCIPEAIRDKPEQCNHFSTTLFVDGKAECFMCGATVNTKRQVIDHG